METDTGHEALSLRVLEGNLEEVRGRILASCERAGRPPGSVSLLPVVKSVGPEVVGLLHRLGIRDVAEGTVQGALEKAERLSGLEGLRWHLVGHLQRNKARKAVRLFASIHSLDSPRLARRLEEEIGGAGEGPPAGPPVPLLYIEVHNGVDATKAGVPSGEIEAFLAEVRDCPRVAARIAGLMILAPYSEDPEAARPHFRRLREMRDHLVSGGLLAAGAGLSMGMSGDFPVAVEEGATVVRVGTRLFEGLPAAGAAAGA